LPGEGLIWAARSRTVRPSSWTGAVTASLWVLGSLVVASLAFAAFYGVFGTRILKVDVFLAVIGIVSGFVSVMSVIALLSFVGTALGERNLDRGTTYAMSDRRVILWRTNPDTKGVEIYSFPRGSFKNLSRVEYPDGTGDVNFALAQPHPPGTPSSMVGIPDVRQVEHHIRRLFMVDPAE
jgi:hypothetical protein